MVDDKAVGVGRCRCSGAAGAGDGGESGDTVGSVGEHSDAVVTAIGDVEVVGAVDGKTGGLIKTLRGRRRAVGGGVTCVALAGDGESDQGAH